MITEDYVSFETAKLLKEKGFDEECFAKYATEKITEKWYDDYRERTISSDWDEGHLLEPCLESLQDYCIYGDTIPAPTQQMAMRWLREVHNYVIMIDLDSYVDGLDDNRYYIVIRRKRDGFEEISPCPQVFFDTYEDAAEAGIKYVLENLI